MKFVWTDDAGQASFDGSLSAGLLEGTVRAGDKQGTLQLAPQVPLSAEAQDRLIGYYEMRPGELLSVTRFPMGPVYVDYSTGRLAVLFSICRGQVLRRSRISSTGADHHQLPALGRLSDEPGSFALAGPVLSSS